MRYVSVTNLSSDDDAKCSSICHYSATRHYLIFDPSIPKIWEYFRCEKHLRPDDYSKSYFIQRKFVLKLIKKFYKKDKDIEIYSYRFNNMSDIFNYFYKKQ